MLIEPKFNYVYNLDGKLYSNTMTTAIISLQWNPFSDYMQTPGRVEVENVFEIYFAVHTIFTKVWKTTSL
jgi:hypothetical protein